MDYATRYLEKIVKVVIERPLGSKHPQYGNVYPINYGYLPDTRAPDGDEVDVYILNVNKPLKEFTGLCIAVIHRTNDQDDKLIVVPKGVSLTDEEIKRQTEFQEKYFKSEIVRK